jgi:hypothetical protein
LFPASIFSIANGCIIPIKIVNNKTDNGLTNQEAKELEIETIKKLKEKDFELCNLTDGGDGSSGVIVSPEERRKRSERMKGVTRPRWIYDKIAASNTGKKASTETRVKQSVAKKGRKCTEEHKRKVSAAKSSPHKITFVDGREIIVENIMDFAKEIGYHYVGFYNVKSGHRKRHKDIIKVELVE